MQWKVVMLAGLLALAGCVDDDAKGDAPDDAAPEQNSGSDGGGNTDNGTTDDEPASSNGGGSEGNETQSGGNETENSAPTVTISAQSVDLVANFTINGTDPDGDSLAWSLDADGDNATDASGESLPANATFTYAAAGEYTAILVVGDGTHNVTLSINVTIEAGAQVQPFEGSGIARSPCPQCTEVGANTGAGYRAGQSGVDSVYVTIPPEYIGATFTATASSGDIDLAFRDGCSGGGTGGGLAGEGFTGAGNHEGTVPEGTVCVLMWNVDTPNTTLTISIA